MNVPEKIIFFIFLIIIIFCLILFYYVLYSYQIDSVNPVIVSTVYVQKEFVDKEFIEGNSLTKETVSNTGINAKLSNSPKIIKAVYVTASSARNQRYLDYLNNLFNTTEINAVVIDIKDYSGQIMFSGIGSLVQELHSKGIYVIARIVVFEDPVLAKSRPDLAIYNKSITTDLKNPVLWRSGNSLWVDPASKEVWDYNISIAKSAISYGFDELNFDYVRFPSDGKTEEMGFPFYDKRISKNLIIRQFFQKLRESLPGIKLSIDLFGYTAVSEGDVGIGQILEDSFDYFDYISLMVYPSHYENGFLGYLNPAEYPYEVVKYSIQEALKRQIAYYSQLHITNKNGIMNHSEFRPWLQDFNMGANYDAEIVKSEIRATTEALGKYFNGFMFWNPSNIYTTGAVLLEPAISK